MIKIYKKIIGMGILFLGAMSTSFSQTFPSGFVHEKLLVKNYPTALSMGIDGNIYVCNSEGGLGVVTKINPATGESRKVVEISAFTDLEKGLVGLVLDPGFSTNGYMYLYYTRNNNMIKGSDGKYKSGSVTNVISRIQIKDGVGDLSTLKIIQEMNTVPYWIVLPNHDGGTMRFGADKKLYVAVGDADLWTGQSSVYFPDGSPRSSQTGFTLNNTFQQDSNFYFGKILRINPDGSAPNDNPFYTGKRPVLDRIFAFGLRNPYSMHFKKNSTKLYINDVGSSGPDKREEVNVLETADLSKNNKNFGFSRQSAPTWDGTPGKTEGETDVEGIVSPTYVYMPPGEGANQNITGCAISGGTFYDPANPTFPNEYRGKYFFMDFCQGWINTIDADGKNVAVFASGLSDQFGSTGGGFGSCAIEEGPDGNMYHLVRSTKPNVSGLYRIKGPLASGTSAADRENKYAFSVHPNPAHHQLNIHFNGQLSEQGTITVYDMMGNVQTSFPIAAQPGFNDETFDISNLTRGVYNVKFSTPNARATQKLIVE